MRIFTTMAQSDTTGLKLGLQHLLAGKQTTLGSLAEDLVAPWYIWLNRREAETQYEQLEPLAFNIDGMHVLRWYGIDLPRDPECPCCGEFLTAAAGREGVEITPERIEAFNSAEGRQ